MTEDRALELAQASLHQGRRLARTEGTIKEYTEAINAIQRLRDREAGLRENGIRFLGSAGTNP